MSKSISLFPRKPFFLAQSFFLLPSLFLLPPSYSSFLPSLSLSPSPPRLPACLWQTIVFDRLQSVNKCPATAVDDNPVRANKERVTCWSPISPFSTGNKTQLNAPNPTASPRGLRRDGGRRGERSEGGGWGTKWKLLSSAWNRLNHQPGSKPSAHGPFRRWKIIWYGNTGVARRTGL